MEQQQDEVPRLQILSWVYQNLGHCCSQGIAWPMLYNWPCCARHHHHQQQQQQLLTQVLLARQQRCHLPPSAGTGIKLEGACHQLSRDALHLKPSYLRRRIIRSS
jgi:hypothetical protein